MNVPFRFETLRPEQEELVKKWLAQDYVAAHFYGSGLDITLESMKKFLSGEETIFTHWIGYVDEMPFAFLMTSTVDPKEEFFGKYLSANSKAITLDLLIGNQEYLGKGLCAPMIRAFIAQQHPQVTDVFIDPAASNAKAVHVYAKAGFKKVEDYLPEWDPTTPHVLMQWKT